MTAAAASSLSLPPLMRAEAAPAGADPLHVAAARAEDGCDPGLILHNDGGERLSAALVLAPEAPLEDAMAMVFAASLGLSDAIGALGPPETAFHFVWPDGFRLNGAACGEARAAASTHDPAAEPDWLVVGFDLALTGDEAPGAAPERTSLADEGCGEVEPYPLLESWSRHTLYWINRWLDEGMAPLHADWTGRAHGIGEDASPAIPGATARGRFLGIDERGGMLLREGDATRLVPLVAMLERPC